MFAHLAGWLREQRIAFSADAPIAPHLYFKIGGTVSMLIPSSSPAQLAQLLKELCSEKLPFLVIGGGSNIVFPDGLTRAAVLLTQPAAGGAPVLAPGGRSLRVDCGMRNQPFLSWCAASGAGGLEFLSGIPGTLAGAAAVNAGAFGRSLADVLLGADIVDASGNAGSVDAGYFDFSYRSSRFKFGSETLLALRLECSPEDEAAIAKKTRENLEYRLERHPSYRLASAGCFFKNPLLAGVKTSAGKIIEECGLKNAAVGDLAVADEHANFLLNRGRGTFADLQRLEEKIRERVAARTGIVLEREVIYVSPEGKKY
ncbi:MAG TPA: UDP-N-acetylmuramate dehydrogenase [Acidobacteriota bacterium]